jgi:drug/metabolite transporter (DMT)-like permease
VEPSGFGPGVGMASALVSALAWTLVSLLARELSAKIPSLSLNVIRSAGGSLLLLPVALAFGDPGSLARVTPFAWLSLVVSVLTAFGVGDTAFFESTKYLGLARAMTIATAGYPLIASALAFWWFGERITVTIAVGSLVMLGGLTLIVSEHGAEASTRIEGRRRGLALAGITALGWAVGAAMMKPPVRELDPLTIQAVRLPLTTLLLWATPWARGTARGLWEHRQGLGSRLLALSGLTALSAVTYLMGLKYAGVALATVLSSASPLFALPVGFLAFGERVTWRGTTGAALSVAGIAIVSR